MGDRGIVYVVNYLVGAERLNYIYLNYICMKFQFSKVIIAKGVE